MPFEVVIHTDKCQGCGNCVVICPPNSDFNPESGLGFGPNGTQVLLKVVKGQIAVINPKLCNGCGACLHVCANKAIEIVPVKPTSAEAVFIVGEAKEETKKGKEEEARHVTLEELPTIPVDMVEQVRGGIGTISELLKTVKVRYFIELGRLSSAEEEIIGKLRHQSMATKARKTQPEENAK